MWSDIVSSVSAIIIIAESYNNKPHFYPLSLGFILSYFGYDIVYNSLSMDYILHHGITSIFLIVSILFPYPLEIHSILCGIEWSTLVLNIIPYVSTSYTTCLRLLFFSLFFKFRIYNWYYMFQQYTFLPIQLIPPLALYTLNLYWFVIILKIMFKKINLNGLKLNSSYIMLGNSILIYYNYPELKFIQFTSFLLGISSYLYHNEMDMPIIQSKWIVLYITTLHLFQAEYMCILGDGWSLFSLYSHFLNLFYIFKYEPKNSILASIPSIGLDILYLLYITQSIELFTISVMIIFIYFINPFYDLSYICNYLLLCWYIFTLTNHLHLKL